MEMNNNTTQIKEAYNESLKEPLVEIYIIARADIVVGIPFDIEGNIEQICLGVSKGLQQFYPDSKCVILCVGDQDSEATLSTIKDISLSENIKILSFTMKGNAVNGWVWKTTAIIDIAEKLDADLALLGANLITKNANNKTQTFSPEWIRQLLLPIEEEQVDLVIPMFPRHYKNNLIAKLLIYPLLASVFNLRISGLPGGVFGISNMLLKVLLSDYELWGNQIDEYGFDSWIITNAIVNEALVCETNIGSKINRSYHNEEIQLKQQIKSIMDRVATNKDYWLDAGGLIYTAPMMGNGHTVNSEEITFDPDSFERYKQGFNSFEGLIEEIASKQTYIELKKLAGTEPEDFQFTPKLWVQIVYDFLLCYCLEPGFNKDQIIEAFIPLYYGVKASFCQKCISLKNQLRAQIPDEANNLAGPLAKRESELLTEEFIRNKPNFLQQWRNIEEKLKPILPLVTYREFIPGVPIIAPKEVTSPLGDTVNTDQIYKNINERFRTEFYRFIHEELGIPKQATSSDMAKAIKNMFINLEHDLNDSFIAGDLTTVEGTKKTAQAILTSSPHSQTFALLPDVVSWLLRKYPPTNLLIQSNVANTLNLENIYSPGDILALSSFSEEPEYMARIWEWVTYNARPELFGPQSPELVVVDWGNFPTLSLLKEPSALSKLTGRIVINNLREGSGGEFPKLRYFTTIIKNLVEAERFGEVWSQFIRERVEFGTRIVNSLIGHWGRDPLSAHNIFENKIHRILAERVREMAGEFAKRDEPSYKRLAKSLNNMADSYHLTQTLPDGTFLSCSAWSWASFSYKGGKGMPTALSLHVERDWASREFLLEMFKALGHSEESIDLIIADLMGKGQESENLAGMILPRWGETQEVEPTQLLQIGEVKASPLVRFSENPILRPVKQHEWESMYVFNPGIIRLKGKTYILYRASGADEVSRIGLAISSDGFHIDERLESPIFNPEGEWETRGCEDPRLILIGQQIYMLYTAYNRIVPQIAVATININDFLNRRWDKWKRQGLAFPGYENKDATLFPEKFDGKYYMYHRTEPSIWISSSDHLRFPWRSKDHRILMGPTAGMGWDSYKVGGGSQPVKTKYGWLLICHGVDHAWVYRLGVLLVSLDDPGQILYRSPNSILEPTEACEVGEDGCYVPNVVFTCGVTSMVDKEVLDDDDDLFVYYGASDTSISVATAKISDLIPKEIRQAILSKTSSVL
jgi:predicted GH43/DUF377 family glycosyl hydrolase